MFFSDVIGQSAIKQKLIESVNDNRISHALLFSGPQGSGKLALALAMTQYIMCTAKKENDSCGVCPACLKNARFVHPDTHFIFPVIKGLKDKPLSDYFLDKWRVTLTESPYFSLNQWTGILDSENKQTSIYAEESENLIKKIGFKTFESDYKIVIIWNADRMNPVFANKILKLLEEPPDRTIFILMSEYAERLLPTILSRTQIIKIPPVSDDDLISLLQEKHNLDEIQAYNFAKISDGNYINLMETLRFNEDLAYNKNTFISLMRNSWQGNASESLKWVDEVSAIGREKQKNFFLYASRMVRENFIFSCDIRPLNKLMDDELAFTEKFAKFIHKDNVIRIANEFNLAHYHIERNGYAKIILYDLMLKLGKLLKN